MIPRRWRPPAAWAAIMLVLTSVPVPSTPVDDVRGLDKVAHLVLYGVLGYLVTRAAWERPRAWQPVAAAFAGVLVYAALDEWHQSFIPGRSSDLLDLAADALGAFAGTAVAALGLSRSERFT